RAIEAFRPFRAVIEATETHRWLYDLLSPLGTVLVAHPLQLHAMMQRRSKTDKLDAQLLANLLRINQVPLSHVPEARYEQLRAITRHRARMARGAARSKTQLRALLARRNIQPAFKCPFGPRGVYWFGKLQLGLVDNVVRDELLERLAHYEKQLERIDAQLQLLAPNYKEIEALTSLRGIALYSALLIIGELSDVTRFRRAKQ